MRPQEISPHFSCLGMTIKPPLKQLYYLPVTLNHTTVSYHREQVIVSLSRAHELSAKSIYNLSHELATKSICKYKDLYNQKAALSHLKVRDWVLVRFPQEEVWKLRKLSCLWHGPYQVISQNDPDVTFVQVYSPQE